MYALSEKNVKQLFLPNKSHYSKRLKNITLKNRTMLIEVFDEILWLKRLNN